MNSIFAYFGQFVETKGAPILTQSLSHYAVPLLMALGATTGAANAWVAASVAVLLSAGLHLAHFDGAATATPAPAAAASASLAGDGNDKQRRPFGVIAGHAAGFIGQIAEAAQTPAEQAAVSVAALVDPWIHAIVAPVIKEAIKDATTDDVEFSKPCPDL